LTSANQVVDIDVDSEWPTLRTNVANLRYHSGWFRVAGSNKVVYRADGSVWYYCRRRGYNSCSA
jgi:hypothetical protein